MWMIQVKYSKRATVRKKKVERRGERVIEKKIKKIKEKWNEKGNWK